jgi:hypothetical protein
MPTAYATPTSYYLKKYVTESVQIAGNGANTCKHVWVTFRLGEFYLNYAEALMNLAGDGYTAPSGYSASATAAYYINQIRKRAGLGEIEAGLDVADFKARYEKERFVELAFEGHRFFDVRRWKEADKYFKTIYGLEITKNADDTFTEKKVVVENRLWDDKMYLFPIPQSEILKSGGALSQNPGW